MSFDRQQLYITGTGQIGTGGGAGEDIFSFGIRFTGLSTYDALASLAALDTAAVAALYNTFWTDTNTAISNRAHLYAIKFSPLGTDGFLLDDPVVEEPVPGGANGNASGNAHPNQVALAVTLRTATTVGLAVRGRFYLPCPAFAVLTNGRYSTGVAGNVAANVKTLLDGINSELALGGDLAARAAIMSRVGGGTTKGVTVVSVGDVMDTVRSRRNALDETYVNATLA